MNELGIEVIYSTTSDNFVSRSEMEKRAKENGIPFELLPKTITEDSLFKRTTSSIVTTFYNKEEPIYCKELTKQMSPKNTIVRVFEKHFIKNGNQIEVARMFFNKKTGYIKYSILTEDGRNIVNSVLDKYNSDGYDGYSSEKEVRASIQKASELFKGVKLRKNGGVFFIPKNYIPYWDAYAKIYKDFNCVEFVDLTVNDDERSKATIFNAIERDIKESVCNELEKFGVSISADEKLNNIVDAFKDAIVSGNIKIDAWNNMVQRFDLYLNKICIYSLLIGNDLDSLYNSTIYIKNFLTEELCERQDLNLFG